MNSRAKILFISVLVILEFIFSSNIVLGVHPHLAIIALVVLSRGMSRRAVLFAAMFSGYLADILLAEEPLSHFLSYVLIGLLILVITKALRPSKGRIPVFRVALVITVYESALALMSPSLFWESWLPYVFAQMIVSVILVVVWVRGSLLLEKKL